MMWAKSAIVDCGALQKGGKRSPYLTLRAESLEGTQILQPTSSGPKITLCRPCAFLHGEHAGACGQVLLAMLAMPTAVLRLCPQQIQPSNLGATWIYLQHRWSLNQWTLKPALVALGLQPTQGTHTGPVHSTVRITKSYLGDH